MNNTHSVVSRKIAALALVTTLALANGSLMRAEDAANKSAAAKPAAPRLFGGQVVGATHLTATISKINYETREVYLKLDEGLYHPMIVSPNVKRFNELNLGDTIEVVAAESVVVLAGDYAGAPKSNADAEAIRADKTEKPGGALVVTINGLATITAIDAKARTVTLKGPKRTATINVEAKDALDKVKVGDSVYVEVTKVVAASVTKTEPLPAPAK